ncbi:MAG: hypothetical protein E7672_07510 [Ruminococcaceae bacterium]|nr:hypothetical protein [Oscillospiraceae bacterium]
MRSEFINQIKEACLLLERCRLSSYSDAVISAADRSDSQVYIKHKGYSSDVYSLFSLTEFDSSDLQIDSLIKLSDHAKIYRKYSDIGAVLHLKSYYVSLFAYASLPIKTFKNHVRCDIGEIIPVSDPITLNKSLYDVISDTYDPLSVSSYKDSAIIIPKFGAVILGKNPISASETALIIENTAKYYYTLCKMDLSDRKIYNSLRDHDLRSKLR